MQDICAAIKMLFELRSRAICAAIKMLFELRSRAIWAAIKMLFELRSRAICATIKMLFELRSRAICAVIKMLFELWSRSEIRIDSRRREMNRSATTALSKGLNTAPQITLKGERDGKWWREDQVWRDTRRIWFEGTTPSKILRELRRSCGGNNQHWVNHWMSY